MISKNLLKTVSVIIAIILLVSMSGCSLYIASIDKLLRSPMSDPEIEKTLEKEFGSSVTLLAPSMKEDDDAAKYLSSTLNYADIDSDGKDEVICFYSEKASPEIIHILILKSSEEKWNIISDTKGPGSEILSLRVIELSDSKDKQIVTTWKYVDSQILSISALGDGDRKTAGLVSVCKDISFDELQMVDVDSDGYREMLVINYSSASINDENVKFLTLLGTDSSGQIVALGQADLPEGCISPQLTVSKASQETPLLMFLDYSDKDDVFHSCVYYWDISGNRLANVFDGTTIYRIDSEGVKSVSTFNSARSSPSKCVDINNDGTVDIPLSQSFSQSGDAQNAVDCTVWTKVVFSKDGTCLFSVAESEKRIYFDDVNYFKIPAYFDESKFYAFKDNESQWSFIYGEFDTVGEAESADGSCFAVVVETKDSEVEEYEDNGYAVLGKTVEETGTVFMYKITVYGLAMELKRDDIFNVK